MAIERRRARVRQAGAALRYELAPLVVASAGELALAEPECDLDVVWDAERVLVVRRGERVELVSGAVLRGAGGEASAVAVADPVRDWASSFPAIVRALHGLAADAFALDGFVCAFDDAGRPSYERLRAHVAGRAAHVMLIAWDALSIAGEDLRACNLVGRRARLRALFAGAPDVLSCAEPLVPPASVGPATRLIERALAAVAALGQRAVAVRDQRGVYPQASTPAVVWRAVGCAGRDREPRGLSPPPPITNRDKVLYPADGFTKADIVAYYADVAPVLLPLLADRPTVAQRWPDGIDDFTWYQHRPPPRCPDYIKTLHLAGDRRMVLASRDALLWMVNQAALTFHGWASRAAHLESPDWLILDLNPGEHTAWGDTIAVALAVRRLLELLELPSVPKTSGQKGLHVLVPLAPGVSSAQAHAVASRAAGMIARLLPELTTLETERDKRRGRLFIDHLQNFVGKTLVLPYSLRAAPGAPVSTPLDWAEVTPALDPRAFNLRTLRARLDARGDLAAALRVPGAELAPVLAKLAP